MKQLFEIVPAPEWPTQHGSAHQDVLQALAYLKMNPEDRVRGGTNSGIRREGRLYARRDAETMQQKLTVKDAVRWIRANCQVDTGSGIYGKASQYTAAEITKAIRSWNGLARGEKGR